MRPVFASAHDFAQLVGLSERNIQNMIRDGRLPTLKVGRRRLVKVEAGLAAIEQASETTIQ